MSDYDRWKTSPPLEPDVAGKCAKCEADLYEGCEYTYDALDGEYYCDSDCFFDKMRDNMTTKVIEAPERDDW
jgi:hypothetical protein